MQVPWLPEEAIRSENAVELCGSKGAGAEVVGWGEGRGEKGQRCEFDNQRAVSVVRSEATLDSV